MFDVEAIPLIFDKWTLSHSCFGLLRKWSLTDAQAFPGRFAHGPLKSNYNDCENSNNNNTAIYQYYSYHRKLQV